MIDPSIIFAIGSEGAREVPAKFKCGRSLRCQRDGELSKSGNPRSTVGIHKVVVRIRRVYKAAAISTAHHQSRFGRSKPIKSTQQWRSRWVEGRGRSPVTVKLRINSIRHRLCHFRESFERVLHMGIHFWIVKLTSEQ